MDKKHEFITVKDYFSRPETIKSDVISAKNYYENLKKELLPKEFSAA